MEIKRLRLEVFYALMLPALLLVALSAVAIGSTPLAWQTIVKVCGLKAGLAMPGVSETDQLVVWVIRIPRVLVAAAVGAGLGTGGCDHAGAVPESTGGTGI